MSQADQPATILIVEDDENLRLALTDNLVDEGYRVFSTLHAEARARPYNRASDTVRLVRRCFTEHANRRVRDAGRQ